MGKARNLSKLIVGSTGAIDVASSITDGSVTTAKINDAAITTAKIADATIATGDIADNAITSAKIADGTIATGDIANSAITTAKLADANVTLAKLSATGTPSSSTYLRGDNTWATVSGGVTSAVAGNGITVSGATGAVTISQDIYTGSTQTNSSFPIGTYLQCLGVGNPNQSISALNASATIRIYSNGGQYGGYTANYGSGTVLSGTWRCRGGAGADCCSGYLPKIIMVQRTA